MGAVLCCHQLARHRDRQGVFLIVKLVLVFLLCPGPDRFWGQTVQADEQRRGDYRSLTVAARGVRQNARGSQPATVTLKLTIDA